MRNPHEILRASLVRHFGLYGEILENYIAGLLKCNNVVVMVQTLEELAKQYKGKKAPNVRAIKDAYFAVFESPGEKRSILSDCRYCYNTGYVLGLYGYQTRSYIPNQQTPVPTDQIEKIAFECACGHCLGKNLEDYGVREKRILKYGWEKEDADKFINDCKELADRNE